MKTNMPVHVDKKEILWFILIMKIYPIIILIQVKRRQIIR